MELSRLLFRSRAVIPLEAVAMSGIGLARYPAVLAIEVRPARGLVHRILGHVVTVLPVREYQVREAVEDQNIAEGIDGEDSMADAADAVHEDHDAQLLAGVAQVAQDEELGDGVVLAVAGALHELLRRRPELADAVELAVELVGPAVEVAVDRLRHLEQIVSAS